MKRLFVAITLTSLPLLWNGGAARADGILDTVKNLAAKPEVQNAAKSGATKAVDMVRGKPAANTTGTGTTGTTGTGATATAGTTGTVSAQAGASIDTVNATLADESKKNQCTFKVNSDAIPADCDAKLGNLQRIIFSSKFKLMSAQVQNPKFEVVSYADPKGNATTNKLIADKRATNIAAALVKKGLPQGDVTSLGMAAETTGTTKAGATGRFEVRVKR